MRSLNAISTLVATAALFASSVVGEVDPIIIKGSKFFYKTNGTEFFIKGVAYQQSFGGNGTSTTLTNNAFVDPLANPTACARDIPLLQELQTNTIRVYAIDVDQDHTACMNLLQDAGIYVIADLSQPSQSINRDDPTWDDDLYARYTSVVDVMQNWTNTLGFFAGNEVSNKVNNTLASAFVKAAVRDTKAYIAQKGYRTIGVGYATEDDAGIREDMADYFNCGSAAESIDFWGYNIYSWCGNSSYTLSGYNVRTEEFSAYSVPVFFAEYGCNVPEPRLFTEVGALFGPEMTPVWSGGIVYMYFQETNNYGLVSIDSAGSASKLPDFTALSSQIAQVTPSGVQASAYTPTNSLAACPTVGSNWLASDTLPPVPNAELCGCMNKALTCVPTSEVTDTEIGALFGIVCGLGNNTCAGIASNATTGEYGAYGMCNAREQLGWALNTYYEQQRALGNGASACVFSGSATTQAAVSPTGSCVALISQAGGGTGTVTSIPTGTGASGSASSSKSKAGAVHATTPSLHFGAAQLGAYLFCAVVAGAGMVLL